MTHKDLFDKLSIETSRLTTQAYSTSFSIGIRCLGKDLRNPIYSIYGFVRFADEIVDSFHDYNKEELLFRFRNDTMTAIEEKISLNPILNSFQAAVHQFNIDLRLVDTFLGSMEMDLTRQSYDQQGFEEYVLGSAEVVGLMCLHVFCQRDQEMFDRLKPHAMKLGSAFQKINFLRDLNADYNGLGRIYFPGLDITRFDEESKKKIEQSIKDDFESGFEGIRRLPRSSKLGVYVAYVYYLALFKKICNTSPGFVMKNRINIRNRQKLSILCASYIKHQLNLI
ncbi:MAG TPA: phytoene/squalene synthase family protein [Cyclobacteriaceae bacterium]|nr:phytoene/squalene synthase family protein [Cyclobacteriaceae bacterium]